jgi:hypothetical protein
MGLIESPTQKLLLSEKTGVVFTVNNEVTVEGHSNSPSVKVAFTVILTGLSLAFSKLYEASGRLEGAINPKPDQANVHAEQLEISAANAFVSPSQT